MSRGLAWDVGAWPVCVLQVSIHLMLPSVCCVIVRLKTGSWYDAAHPLRYSPNTSRFASRLVQAMPAWSVKPRRAPSRNCRDARVYGHTATAMHDIEYAPLPHLYELLGDDLKPGYLEDSKQSQQSNHSKHLYQLQSAEYTRALPSHHQRHDS